MAYSHCKPNKDADKGVKIFRPNNIKSSHNTKTTVHVFYQELMGRRLWMHVKDLTQNKPQGGFGH